MKKIFFFIILVFCSSFAYSQTWTEISGFNKFYVKWTVISKEQWDRIRLQKIEDNAHVTFLYTDSFEMEIGGINSVVSGTRPTFNGYYYLYGRISVWGEDCAIIAYGNSDTGRIEILYGEVDGFYYYSAGGKSYITEYNRLIRRVNGE